MAASTASVFCFFANSVERQRAVTDACAGRPERYLLFGMDEFGRYRLRTEHNISSAGRSRPLRYAAAGINRLTRFAGGYGGDFGGVWPWRRRANAADVILSTVDTVGIPLVLLRHFGFIRRPMVYVSIGLPERLAQLRNEAVRRLYARAFRRVERIVCYGFEEAQRLEAWLGADSSSVQFIPFGVDTELFRPDASARLSTDVLSVGRDTQRDFMPVVEFARRHPDRSVRVVTTADHARRLGDTPENLDVVMDISLAQVRDLMAAARVVALPVRPNTYSGATATLVQAMAMGKPVVVSAVGAIAGGYHLRDGVNCVMIPPNTSGGFDQAIARLLSDPRLAASMGEAARRSVVEHHRWECYVEAMARAVLGAAQPALS